MKLRNIDFGSIACAVGARGFYGEGYPFHKVYNFLPGYSWDGYTFAGKTMTLKYRNGNMPLKDDGVTPVESIPKCIWVEKKPSGHMLNCVGLSNFGVEFYLKGGYYQKLEKPFFISIMDMDPHNGVQEIRKMCELIVLHLGNKFGSIYGVQINFACPNTGSDVVTEPTAIIEKLKVAREVLGENIPIIANFNALVNTETLVAIDDLVDAYWIGNAIPAGNEVFSEEVWKEHFNVRKEDGEWKSPFTDRGMPVAGGLSGPICFPITLKKVIDMNKHSGITKPIVAGNGIRTQSDILKLRNAGASMVFVGSAAVTRPWSLKKLSEV